MTRVFWALIALSAIYFVVLGAWSTWAISAGAGWLPIFDARVLGYDQEQARAFLLALSPEGLASYKGLFRQADTVFPILLAATLVLGLLVHHPWRRAVSLGLGPEGIDEDVVSIAARLTMLKWFGYAVALGGLGFGLFRGRRA